MNPNIIIAIMIILGLLFWVWLIWQSQKDSKAGGFSTRK